MAINQELLRRSLVINVEDGFNADGSVLRIIKAPIAKCRNGGFAL